jgi:hypothetical protein
MDSNADHLICGEASFMNDATSSQKCKYAWRLEPMMDEASSPKDLATASETHVAKNKQMIVSTILFVLST